MRITLLLLIVLALLASSAAMADDNGSETEKLKQQIAELENEVNELKSDRDKRTKELERAKQSFQRLNAGYRFTVAFFKAANSDPNPVVRCWAVLTSARVARVDKTEPLAVDAMANAYEDKDESVLAAAKEASALLRKRIEEAQNAKVE